MRARCASLALALILSACSRGPDLLPVTLPDLAKADPSVEAQVRQRHDALISRIESDADRAELARAYGDYGMILHAAEYYSTARPAYLNAQTLDPEEPRWPYFLAHIARSEGALAAAVEHFNRVLALRPGDLPTLIWLARVHIDLGEPDTAEPLLQQAQSGAPRTLAVVAALGQTALARREYQRAAALLEEALTIDPAAQSVHAPLAQAYRALGDPARADAHLTQWRNTDILLPDPWRQELDLTLESGLAYEIRGVRALDQQDFPTAAALFRKGLGLTPDSAALGRSLRHKLGTALFLSGDARGAVDEFERVLALAPAEGLDEPSAKAAYSLGIVAASSGQGADAVRRFTAALRYNPGYVEARVALADALRRGGRADASLEHYAEVVRLRPRATDARLGYALALVRLRRYVEARRSLEEAVRAQPGRPELEHALARVLAAAPAAAARDGARAFEIVEQLFKTDKTTALGETMAMAFAELGQFEEAIGVQRGVLDAARRANLAGDVRRMEANLRLYERRQPCRTPWPDDDPVHQPGPPISTALASATAG